MGVCSGMAPDVPVSIDKMCYAFRKTLKQTCPERFRWWNRKFSFVLCQVFGAYEKIFIDTKASSLMSTVNFGFNDIPLGVQKNVTKSDVSLNPKYGSIRQYAYESMQNSAYSVMAGE